MSSGLIKPIHEDFKCRPHARLRERQVSILSNDKCERYLRYQTLLAFYHLAFSGSESNVNINDTYLGSLISVCNVYFGLG